MAKLSEKELRQKAVREIVEEICEFGCKWCSVSPKGSKGCIRALDDYAKKIEEVYEDN